VGWLLCGGGVLVRVLGLGVKKMGGVGFLGGGGSWGCVGGGAFGVVLVGGVRLGVGEGGGCVLGCLVLVWWVVGGFGGVAPFWAWCGTCGLPFRWEAAKQTKTVYNQKGAGRRMFTYRPLEIGPTQGSGDGRESGRTRTGRVGGKDCLLKVIRGKGWEDK